MIGLPRRLPTAQRSSSFWTRTVAFLQRTRRNKAWAFGFSCGSGFAFFFSNQSRASAGQLRPGVRRDTRVNSLPFVRWHRVHSCRAARRKARTGATGRQQIQGQLFYLYLAMFLHFCNVLDRFFGMLLLYVFHVVVLRNQPLVRRIDQAREVRQRMQPDCTLDRASFADEKNHKTCRV